MTSLSSIITAASVSLKNTQYSIALANQNVSNASTAGYTTKSYVASASSVGVALSEGEVTRTANSYLQKTVVSSSAAYGAASVVDQYLQLYDAAFGAVNGGDDLASLLSAFQSSLTALTSSQTASTRTSAVAAAEDLAASLSGLSNEIQSLRTQADQDIASTVDSINGALQGLASINTQIAAAAALGQDTTALFDARDQTLTELSAMLGVSYSLASDGRVSIYTASGEQLLGSTAATLGYTAAGKLSADAVYPDTIGGITLNGKDITGSISSGKLGGLIDLRDGILVDEQVGLDSLASALIEAVNTAAADGSAYPPPTALTSALKGLTGSDAFSGTGNLRIATLSSDGMVATVTDVDLSGVSTIGDLVSTLDAVDGINASLDASGRLVLTSEDGTSGIAIGGLDSAVNGKSFSAAFGFNPVFTGDSASNIAVSSALAADPTLLAAAALSDADDLAAGDRGLASGDGSTATTIVSALTANRDFAASGSLSARTSSIADYSTAFVSAASTRISAATSTASSTQATNSYATAALTNLTGVNLDEQTALLTQFQSQYQVAAQLISITRDLFDTLIGMMN
ncbi:MAG: flagellar hook-associated protein FlgK [Caulobacter sp.]|nr:flagellar hook-associated protein FlgK [Caulobacter sp.]